MERDPYKSEKQAEGAVVIARNKLFDRKWKYHEECEDKVDIDTLPRKSNHQIN